MLTFLKVMAFNSLVVLFFWYVGNSIPQQRKDPPKESTLTADMAPEVFVAAGQDIFYGKGTCALCHTIGEKGERCPNLAGIGQRADARLEEASYQGDASNGAEYVVESLHNPAVYVVDGYQPTMPALGRQLNDLEIVAVVAFMQSLGGEVTVTGETLFPKYRADSGTAVAAAPAAGAAPAMVAASGGTGSELVAQWGCISCHSLDAPVRLVGPSLWDIGARQDEHFIRESILKPDAVVAEGFPPSLMKLTLDGQGFYQKLAVQDLNTLVDYLASLKGGQ
jgi:cytochrome c2